MGVVAPDETALAATGWLATDSTRRYWSHPLRYGEAQFDRHEVAELEERPTQTSATSPTVSLPASLRAARRGHLLEVREAGALTAGVARTWPKRLRCFPLS